MKTDKISLLYPSNIDIQFNELSEDTMHDLGMDLIIKNLSSKESEQNLIAGIMSKITDNPLVSKYRIDVFDDIFNNKPMRDELMKILDKVTFLKDYGSFNRKFLDGPSVWDLMHRLEEINDYITSVEAIHACLENADIKSEGLLALKAYVEKLYNEKAFGELKADVENCKASTKDLKSITLGVNLNDKFEASEIGVISINNKFFTKSNIISNFYDRLSANDSIHDGTDWDGNNKYIPFSASSDIIGQFEHLGKMTTTVAHPLLMTSMAHIPDGDSVSGVTYYMNSITNRLLSHATKKLRAVLDKYVAITITDITNLIPEFVYYIRWAEYYEVLIKRGATLSKANVVSLNSSNSISRTDAPHSSNSIASSDASHSSNNIENSSEETIISTEYDRFMDARGIYNIKLVAFESDEHLNIITNDLIFNKENLLYILTGANRGGKTTITQAVGQLFMLAQGGMYIPGDSFTFNPVDNIFTHFPADEDKTMDLGRLGEECKRFKEMFSTATASSLMLLNETFSTTSFEEGYYIAKDSVRAILKKGIRTIYNTHMHKLAFDIDELNDKNNNGSAKSLIVKSEGGNRSYKVEVAAPVGQSFAKDIAVKYGVTYEMLIGEN